MKDHLMSKWMEIELTKATEKPLKLEKRTSVDIEKEYSKHFTSWSSIGNDGGRISEDPDACLVTMSKA